MQSHCHIKGEVLHGNSHDRRLMATKKRSVLHREMKKTPDLRLMIVNISMDQLFTWARAENQGRKQLYFNSFNP